MYLPYIYTIYMVASRCLKRWFHSTAELCAQGSQQAIGLPTPTWAVSKNPGILAKFTIEAWNCLRESNMASSKILMKIFMKILMIL